MGSVGSGPHGNVMQLVDALSIGHGVVDVAFGRVGWVITGVEKGYQVGDKQDPVVTEVDNVQL